MYLNKKIMEEGIKRVKFSYLPKKMINRHRKKSKKDTVPEC